MAPGEAAGGQVIPTATPWSPYLEEPARQGLSCRHVGTSPLLGLRGHLPLSHGLWGSGLLEDLLEKQRQRAEQSAGEGGWAPFPGNAPGQGFCVTEVRPGSGAELLAPPVDLSGRLRRRWCRRKRNALNLRNCVKQHSFWISKDIISSFHHGTTNFGSDAVGS